MLSDLDIGPALGALNFDCELGGMSRHLVTHMRIDELSGPSAPNLQSLALANLDISPDLDQKLVDILDRGDGEVILESLVVQSWRSAEV